MRFYFRSTVDGTHWVLGQGQGLELDSFNQHCKRLTQGRGEGPGLVSGLEWSQISSVFKRLPPEWPPSQPPSRDRSDGGSDPWWLVTGQFGRDPSDTAAAWWPSWRPAVWRFLPLVGSLSHATPHTWHTQTHKTSTWPPRDGGSLDPPSPVRTLGGKGHRLLLKTFISTLLNFHAL